MSERYRYEIDNDNAIRMWDSEFPNEDDAPFLYQPHWPNGTPWADAEDAKNWADVYVESMIDHSSEFVPGNDPDNHPMPRPASTEGLRESAKVKLIAGEPLTEEEAELLLP